MKAGASAPFAAPLNALREAAGYTQEELATIAVLLKDIDRARG
jgi:hypothetical protein